MSLPEKLREHKIEQIRVYLDKVFPKYPHTRDDVLDLVVTNFHSRYFQPIMEANREKEEDKTS